MSAAAFEVIEAQRAADAALQHIARGMAPPDMLADLLEQLPPAQRRAALRTVQKAIEQAGAPQLCTQLSA